MVELNKKKKLFTPKTKFKSRVLVGCGGILKSGAFMAGWLARLSYEFGPEFKDFFNGGMYLTSVSVYDGTFALANQPKTIINTWKNYISGSKLANKLNYFIGRETIKLRYLTRIFKNQVSWLDTKAVLKGKRPNYVVTNLETGKVEYKKPKNAHEIFEWMEAACTIPGLSKTKRINGKIYCDGGLSVGFPISKALKEADEIIVLMGRPIINYKETKISKFASKIHILLLKIRGRKIESKLCEDYNKKLKNAEDIAISHPEKVEIVSPEKSNLSHGLDTSDERISETVDLGWIQAGKWLFEHGYQKKFDKKREKALLENLMRD